MATYTRFEDLDIWQKSRELAKQVYFKSIEGSFAKDFSLRDQINRSTGSVMDNIAEGFERDGRQEFLQFLSYSKSSAAEVRSQLYRALDRGHINQNEFDELYEQSRGIGKMVGGFMNYLRKSEIKGLKYKASEPEEYYEPTDVNGNANQRSEIRN
jgi:four helix bundle protein